MQANDPVNSTDSPDLTGRTVGEYRLLRRLGRGAMAEVYLAEQSSLRRHVAVKILKPKLADDETYLRRFRQEAQAAASLVHGNIVQIHEVGCRDGLHFIVQEYVPGPNLRELLNRQGPPRLPQALSIMRQIAAALCKSAEQGIVHRDIKPENILLAPDGQAKVADFGLARSLDPAQAVNLTQVGVTMGTPLYMSPEQIEGRTLDARSDLYSFGITCYELLTGEPPFRGETSLAVAVQHLKKAPEPIASLRADVPAELARVIHRLLAKQPVERYQQARELLADLQILSGNGQPVVDSAVGSTAETWPTIDALTSLSDDPALSKNAAFSNAATPFGSRLQDLMRTQSMAARPRIRWGRWLAGAVAAGLLGAIVGLAFRPSDLLARGQRRVTELPRQENVWSEYYQASVVNTPEAWQGLLEHHPSEVYVGRTAKMNLARLWLHERNFAEAEALFRELAQLPESEVQFRAFGLAGQFLVAAQRDRPREATAALNELWPLRDDLEPRMRQSLDSMLRTNRAALDAQAADEWETWLNQNAGEE